MDKENLIIKYLRRLSDSSLLSFVIFTIFIIPLFPISLHKLLYAIGYTFIFILAAMAVNKYRSGIFIYAVIITILHWTSFIFFLPLLNQIMQVLSIFFFFAIILSFIRQVATAAKVSAKLLLESINGYLMLGLAFAVLISLIMEFNPAAYHIPDFDSASTSQKINLNNFLYYSFVTLTTVGYGDILPKAPATKSLAIFIAIVGQFYIAIIIATLISKYLKQDAD